MREWRERHPMVDAWNNHRFNAKKRGIAVEWNYDEFKLFCEITGYHILRKNGLTIDRENCLLGYNLKNCQVLSHYDNSVKGSRIEKWIKQKKST